MQQEIQDFISSQRVGVLAVEMLDGSPHGATVHFAHSADPLEFYFETNRDYRKSEPLYGREISRATFVIGTDETAMKTLQLDGEVMLLKPEEQALFDSAYLGKFPEKAKKSQDPKSIFFKFTPRWWRFTDFKTPEGKKITTSN
jgi:general stress protein 26